MPRRRAPRRARRRRSGYGRRTAPDRTAPRAGGRRGRRSRRRTRAVPPPRLAKPRQRAAGRRAEEAEPKPADDEGKRVGGSSRRGAEAALVRRGRGPGVAQRGEPQSVAGGARQLPVGAARPEIEERRLLPAGQAAVGQDAQHGEIEVEVRRGRGLRRGRGAGPVEGGEAERQDQQARERARAGRRPAQRGGGNPAGLGGGRKRANAVGRGGAGHGVAAGEHSPVSAAVQPSWCSNAARSTSSSWQWPDQAAASSEKEARSREGAAALRMCRSH